MPKPHRLALLGCSRVVAQMALGMSAGVLTGWASLSPAQAEPAQRPLLSQVGSQPLPNVMLTLDDSSSMNWDFMPEGLFSLNGASRLGLSQGAMTGAFPDDPLLGNGRTVTLAWRREPSSLENVYQKQYRSPDVNSLFYNPDVRYQPWVAPSGGRLPAYPAAAARHDPLWSSAENLSAVRRQFSANYCTAFDVSSGQEVCAPGTADFSPGLYYRLRTGADPTQSSAFERFDINVDGEHAPPRKHPARTDCAGPRCTQTEERQNFANWFTYHRHRLNMAKAALSEALAQAQGKLRLGWGSINQGVNRVDGLETTVIRQGLRELTPAHLQTVLQGIQAVQAQGVTPLRSATQAVGAYFRERVDAWSPWLDEPGQANSGRQACRRAFHLLTSDGYYSDEPVNVGDLDSQAGPDHADANPLGASPTRLQPQRPRLDAAPGQSNTLADVAIQAYWQDLDSALPNRVPPMPGNPAFWQHLSQLMVSIGLRGELPAATPAQREDTLARLSAGTLAWPAPSRSAAAKIDDMWHAAVNTGGRFYPVAQATELAGALKDALSQAVGGATYAAGVTTSGSTLGQAGQYKYLSTYRAGTWSGDVSAYPLDAYGQVPSGSLPVWNASARLPSASQRQLWSWNGVAPVAFNWQAFGSANQASLLNYVRGDSSQEGAGKLFRSRAGQLLGDFIDSPPTLLRQGPNLRYDLLGDPAQASSYRAYFSAKNARADGVLFIGSNAGVLSALRASTGQELWGYVPQAGLPQLAPVAQPDYGQPQNFHRFVVNGPLVPTDAYLTPRGEATPRWANLLLGSLGAGGRAVFALNLPTANATALGAQTLQWELSTDADLGYVTTAPQVGKVQGGGWYAFIGNGVDSPSGQAALLVVDVQTGRIVQRLRPPAASGTGSSNGLMGVSLLRNAQQEVYAAYAGDLLGNLWRFEFPSADAASWRLGFGGKPLYRATGPGRQPQAITAAPLVLAHPQGGHLLLFGTGRLLDEVDVAAPGLQSFYGVWDRTPQEQASAGAPVGFAVAEASGQPYRTLLQEQSVGAQVIQGSDGQLYRSVSSRSVDWATQLGWFLDLNMATGQRVLARAQAVASMVYIHSLVPPPAAAPCEVLGGTSFHLLLDALSGGARPEPVFDLNADGLVNALDQVTLAQAGVAAVQSQGAMPSQLMSQQEGVIQDGSGPASSVPACRPDPAGKCPAHYCLVAILGPEDAPAEVCVPDRCAADTNALNCRDKVITDRIWRPLLNPPQP